MDTRPEAIRPYPRPESARLVSYSELQSMDCWLKHHYAYGLGLKPVQRFAALRLGSAWDTFLNTYHAPVVSLPPLTGVEQSLPTTEDRLAAGLRDAGAAIDAEARRVDTELLEKGIDRPFNWTEQVQAMRDTILGMAYHYVARWETDDADWRTLDVQLRFEVPFPSATGSGRASSRYWLHGVIDRVAEHIPTGEVYVIDAKLRDGSISDDWREGFDHDIQLALYGWALRQLPLPYADRVRGGIIDAAAAKLPVWPEVKKQPEPVLDAAGEKVLVPLTDPETGEVLRFASGARKGEVKTKTLTRPAIYTDHLTGTSWPVLLQALAAHGLPLEQYEHDLHRLADEWLGLSLSQFHWRTPDDKAIFTDAQLAQAIGTMVYIGPYLDKLPPAPMPSKMKCKWCSFKSVCPSLSPVDHAEGFTTREQRKAESEARKAREAADELLATPPPQEELYEHDAYLPEPETDFNPHLPAEIH